MRRFEPTNEGAGQRLSMSSYGIYSIKCCKLHACILRGFIIMG
ncbi:MAG: hypothetical protein RXR10_06955 [Vulcanisaeta sp.]